MDFVSLLTPSVSSRARSVSAPPTIGARKPLDAYELTPPRRASTLLPEELWLSVFDHLSDRRDLKNATDACVDFRRAASFTLAKDDTRFVVPRGWSLSHASAYLERYPRLFEKMVEAVAPPRAATFAELEDWFQQLAQAPHLKSLKLADMPLCTFDMVELARALPPQIVSLDVGDCRLSTEQLTELIENLRPTVKALCACRNGVEFWSSRGVVPPDAPDTEAPRGDEPRTWGAPPHSSLAFNTGIRSDHPEGKARAERLGRAVAKNMEHVSLNMCGFDAEFTRVMLEAMAGAERRLQTLELGGLWFNTAAIRALARVMPTRAVKIGDLRDHAHDVEQVLSDLFQALPDTLEKFSLIEPHLGNRAMLALAGRALSNLREVHIIPEQNGGSVTDAVMETFVASLPKTLEYIYIPWRSPEERNIAVMLGDKSLPRLRGVHNGAGIRDNGLVAMLPMYAKKTFIWFTCDMITAEGVKKLVPHLHPELQLLSFYGNGEIGDEGVRALFGHLPESLRELDLNGVGMSDAAALELIRHLPKRMHMIDIQGNNLSQATRAAFHAAFPQAHLRHDYPAKDGGWHRCDDCPREEREHSAPFGEVTPPLRTWPQSLGSPS